MQDFIVLGTTLIEEPYVQVGQDNYYDTVRGECRRVIMLLRRTFGDEPLGVRFAIKSFDHDVGRSYEVVCLFDTDDEEATHYAYRCEEELPTIWEGARPCPRNVTI